MKCEDLQEKLSAYLEQALNDDEQSAVEEHLSACARCSAEVRALKQSMQSVGDLPDVEPPPGFSRRVMSRIQEEADTPGIWQRFFYPLQIKIPIQAVAILLVSGFALYMYQKTLAPQEGIMEEAFRSKLEIQEEKTGDENFENDTDERMMPSPFAGRSNSYQAGKEIQRNMQPLSEEEMPASRPAVNRPQEETAKSPVPGTLQQEGKVDLMEEMNTGRNRSVTVEGESSGLAGLQKKEEGDFADRVEIREFRKEKKAGIAAVPPIRTDEAAGMAHIELVLVPGKGVGDLRRKLDDLIRQAGGETLPAPPAFEEPAQAQAPEPEVLWFTIPQGRYEQLKTDLASLGTIRMESGTDGSISGPDADSYAPAPATSLRIKLTIGQSGM